MTHSDQHGISAHQQCALELADELEHASPLGTDFFSVCQEVGPRVANSLAAEDTGHFADGKRNVVSLPQLVEGHVVGIGDMLPKSPHLGDVLEVAFVLERTLVDAGIVPPTVFGVVIVVPYAVFTLLVLIDFGEDLHILKEVDSVSHAHVDINESKIVSLSKNVGQHVVTESAEETTPRTITSIKALELVIAEGDEGAVSKDPGLVLVHAKVYVFCCQLTPPQLTRVM